MDVGKCLVDLIKIYLNHVVIIYISQMERQIQMQNQMRERAMSLQIARAREMLSWVGSFYTLFSVGVLLTYKRTRNRVILVPLVPFTFIIAYQADLAYGNKLHRIKLEAENIMRFEGNLLKIPCDLPTVSSIDVRRQQQQEALRMHSADPPLYY